MEHMVKVDGGGVWADDSGGDGPPLMLLHPGVGDSRIWDPVLPALTARHRVLRYDVRGYGRSPLPTARYSLLADLVAVLDHFGLDGPVPLVGCSMGGGTALGLALADPGRVASLVLVCPGVDGYPWPEPPADVRAAFATAAEAGDVDRLTEIGMQLWGAAGSDAAAIAQMRSAARAWLTEDDFQLPDEPVFDRLGEIAAPTVLLAGDRDRPSNLDCCLETAARIPGCTLRRLPEADHLLPLREPEAVAETVPAHCGG